MHDNSIKISAVVITYNEESNITRCIDSLKPVADEIIIVDCFSEDDTKKICLEKGVNFYENEFLGFADQKNYAVSLAKNEFVLSLDADEYLSSELIKSILLIKSNSLHDGYIMNRLSSYAGEWIKTCGWYPDSKLRLWRKEAGFWKGGGIHEWVEMPRTMKIKRLHGDLLHHAYDNITQFLEKIQRYSDIYAIEHRLRMHSSTFKVLYKTLYAFVKSFIIKRGIFDGYKGLLISVCNANFVFYKYSKLLEANKQLKTSLIISTYNREDALELTLLSILGQSVMPDEVIIADDGSKGETRELINRYREKFPAPLIHCWHEDASFQAGQIRNKAIAIASCEYIIHVDGDMVLHKHFIKAHKKVVQRGRFIQGDRVSLSEGRTTKALRDKEISFYSLDGGVADKMSSIFSPLLSKLTSHKGSRAEQTQICNMAFWKDDFLQINGFNEDIIGWGTDDREMSARLMNSGIKKFNLKFAGFAYHLYHQETLQTYLMEKDPLLQSAFKNKLTRCSNGIDKYLMKAKKQAAA
jgi:glycosyltransferase involved in cell wall biosynthesis